MPGNVAVERPHAWVAGGIELHHEVPLRANLEDVSALRVLRVDDCAIPLAVSFVEYVHVEAVEMHGMAGAALVGFA